MPLTETNSNTNQALYDTIDAMCTSVSFLDNFPTAKQSKLIQFSVEFCDDFGVITPPKNKIHQAAYLTESA